eukprot:CAMPEP_0195524670 /NCGR_PEP_ID=MMETSP0794_2-20130614/24639_1 /TAXON_ID=515487 /ORGANISM="Stephanopyxis turris, Strain CCMP 815" /LENGTH=60 /DNA_ID=CAMNT_0040654937 /DNA_START=135 /DNA_END=313 /DNA_ORIENTATION=+
MAYIVANAVPFFHDLAALIGSLLLAPVTLLLPGILYRKMSGVPIFCPPSGPFLAYLLITV